MTSLKENTTSNKAGRPRENEIALNEEQIMIEMEMQWFCHKRDFDICSDALQEGVKVCGRCPFSIWVVADVPLSPSTFAKLTVAFLAVTLHSTFVCVCVTICFNILWVPSHLGVSLASRSVFPEFRAKERALCLR